METPERNNWDRANKQRLNHDPQEGENEQMYQQEAADQEQNPNIDADGYGSESARSEHNHYSSGVSGRSGNTHHESGPSTRGDRNYSSGSMGAAGRAHG